MSRLFLVLVPALLCAACSWVTVDPAARDVLVLPPERLTPACESLGKVKVSVLEKVGVLARHEEEVIEDLDALARNQAAKQGGDTAVPRSSVSDGAREYEIFRCTDGAAKAGAKPDPGEPTPPPGKQVEVLPYDGGSDGN